MAPARRAREGFLKFSPCMQPARRARVGLTVYRLPLSFSVGSLEIKIRTSSPYKARRALYMYGDEVRILFFDDSAENEREKCTYLCSSQLNSTCSNVPGKMWWHRGT
jgi:hypothetical protein